MNPPRLLSSSYSVSVGAVRYAADKRQFAGLLMVTGMAMMIQPLVDVSGGSGAPSKPTSGILLAGYMGAICVLTTGILSVVTGYVELVHDCGNKFWLGFLIVFTQTSCISYITARVAVAMQVRCGPSFVSSEAYEGTAADNRFIGAMGILAIMAYALGLVGSVAYFQFTLYAYHANKPQHRAAPYYVGRAGLYSVALGIAGISQLLLGSFVMGRFGNFGNDPMGFVQVAFYLVMYPWISVLIGLIQTFNGVWGMVRAYGGWLIFGPNDISFQISLGIGWLLQLILQIIVQPSSVAPMLAPPVAAFAFGLNLMPAYLDYKARTMPQVIEPNYYGLDTGNAAAVGMPDKESEMDKDHSVHQVEDAYPVGLLK